MTGLSLTLPARSGFQVLVDRGFGAPLIQTVRGVGYMLSDQ